MWPPGMRRWGLGGGRGAADAALNVNIPWRIVIEGKAAEVTAELGRLDLAALEVKRGFSLIRLDLPEPSGMDAVRFWVKDVRSI